MAQQTSKAGRELSHDERKAAEAAFRGRPFNPEWSTAARLVYDGIAAVLRQQGSTAKPRPAGWIADAMEEVGGPVGALMSPDYDEDD